VSDEYWPLIFRKCALTSKLNTWITILLEKLVVPN